MDSVKLKRVIDNTGTGWEHPDSKPGRTPSGLRWIVGGETNSTLYLVVDLAGLRRETGRFWTAESVGLVVDFADRHCEYEGRSGSLAKRLLGTLTPPEAYRFGGLKPPDESWLELDFAKSIVIQDCGGTLVYFWSRERVEHLATVPGHPGRDMFLRLLADWPFSTAAVPAEATA